jgi:hypothetical protein
MIRTLVPTGNKASIGITNTGMPPEASAFASHIPRYGGGREVGITFELLPNLRADGLDETQASPFSSIVSYKIYDTEQPCVGIARNAGMVLSRVKHPNVLPNLAGTYPQPVGGRTKNIGLAHTEGMIKSIGQTPVRQPSNFNYQLKSPLGDIPNRG